MSSLLDKLLESGKLPDWIIRIGIRRLLTAKHRSLMPADVETRQQALQSFVADCKRLPIAIETDAANEQHYELPPAFFNLVLGPRRKYSSGLWEPGVDALAQAEDSMLHLYAERAELQDGQRILDLGCGWGSLSLWLAERYPNSTIVGLSNSHNQHRFIMAEAERLGFHNLDIRTGNMLDYEMDDTFDRIVSVEMMEHMKNYGALLAKVSRWLTPNGKLFVHIFTHANLPYHFEDQGPNDWMTRYFFSGGTMPSHDLLLHFQEHLSLEDQWAVNGSHYQKTAEAWLSNMDAHRGEVDAILASTYGMDNVTKWRTYWRVFFMSCAELWGFDSGNAWLVSHYRFGKKAVSYWGQTAR